MAAPSVFVGVAAAIWMRLLDPAAFSLFDGLVFAGIVSSMLAVLLTATVAISRYIGAPALAARQDSEIHLDLPFEQASAVAREALDSIGAKIRRCRSRPDGGFVMRARLPMGRNHWGARIRVVLWAFTANETILCIESRPSLLPDSLDGRQLHLGTVRAFMHYALELESLLLQGEQLRCPSGGGSATTATSSS